MATRQSRKSTRGLVTSEDVAESSSILLTPAATISSSEGSPRMTSTPANTSRIKSRKSSPASPTRISRLKEKQDLQDLNNRLAAYIDRVRHLENENNRLNVQVETIEETMQKEVLSMKGLYDRELQDARKTLTDTCQDKAQLQISIGKLKSENDDLKLQLARKENGLNVAEKALEQAENEVTDLSRKLNISDGDRKKMSADLKDLNARVLDLTRQFEDTKKQLESEVLTRVHLDNRCQGLQEELQFKSQMYEQQLTEVQKRKTVEISELDGELKEKYEARMADVLIELREQYEEQLNDNRAQLESIYETKLDELSRKSAMQVNDHEVLSSTLRDSQNRVKELTSRVNHLESTNQSLQNRIKELEDTLESERSGHLLEMQHLRDEINRLQREMELQLQEYQDLMDIKIALDMEIAAYRRMLESEEERLNMTPGSFDSSMRGLKRKRSSMFSEEETKEELRSSASAHGPIHITEEDIDGKFIRIQNKGEEEYLLAGHELVRLTEDSDKPIKYKFHRTFKIQPDAEVTVWSSDSEQINKPPETLVMKTLTWPPAESFKTQLINEDGEVIAERESKKEKITYKRELKRPGLRDDERCSIM